MLKNVLPIIATAILFSAPSLEAAGCESCPKVKRDNLEPKMVAFDDYRVERHRTSTDTRKKSSFRWERKNEELKPQQASQPAFERQELPREDAAIHDSQLRNEIDQRNEFLEEQSAKQPVQEPAAEESKGWWDWFMDQ